MKVLEMPAWSRSRASLSHDEAAQLAELELVDVLATSRDGTWQLVSNSRIGVATGPGWELRVSPRLAIPKLFFLLAYALDPEGWKDESADFAAERDLLDAIASGFSWHALQAIEQGVLRGYVQIEERLTTIRGRVRFADQIARNADLPFPIELSYSDYTEDIIENQIIKSATSALLRLSRLPVLARRRLLKIRAVLDDVSVVARPREVVLPPITRLNRRYGPALRLAALILRAASIDTPKGALAATAFVFDMNKVFEDFVTTALHESMARFGGELRAQWRGRLDIERQLQIIPDLTWWSMDAVWRSPTRNTKRSRLPECPTPTPIRCSPIARPSHWIAGSLSMRQTGARGRERIVCGTRASPWKSAVWNSKRRPMRCSARSTCLLERSPAVGPPRPQIPRYWSPPDRDAWPSTIVRSARAGWRRSSGLERPRVRCG